MSELLTYADVPKGRAKNLVWRGWLLEQMSADEQKRGLVVESCRQDPLFYVNSFGWTLDDRREVAVIPFITYGFQDEKIILKIIGNLRESMKPENRARRFDLLIEKSRDMGVTWSVLYALDWVWRFDSNRSFRCISRVEDYVDQQDNPDALFQKLDFIESRLPQGLAVRGDNHDPSMGRTRLKVYNPQNGMVFKGESSNENAGRGGRNLGAFRDEEAFCDCGAEITKALNQTTRCQIRVSTPNGMDNSFYAARLKGAIERVTLHWSEHPDKAAGLYSVAGGKVEILDQKWHFDHPGYKFVIGSTFADPGSPWEFLRSPWFDGECAAADSVHDIAQEIQISYGGSGSPFFRGDKLSLVKSEYAAPPAMQGAFDRIVPEEHRQNMEDWRDEDMRQDRMKLWQTPDARGDWSKIETYSIGVDVAAGSGASDSVVSVACDRTQTKVLRWLSNMLTPNDFAKGVLALYRWFTTEAGTPFIAWDQGGHGLTFGATIVQARMCDLYYHKNRTNRLGTEAKHPGIPSNTGIKLDMFERYRAAVFGRKFITHDEEAYDQMSQFVHDPKGGVVHQTAKSTQDSSDTGLQHGDIATSEAVLVLALEERPMPMPQEKPEPEACLAARDRWFEDRRRESAREWYS